MVSEGPGHGQLVLLLWAGRDTSWQEKNCLPHGQDAEESKMALGSFEGKNPITYRPPMRPHLPMCHPSNGTILGSKPLAHKPLWDISEPNCCRDSGLHKSRGRRRGGQEVCFPSNPGSGCDSVTCAGSRNLSFYIAAPSSGSLLL